MTQRSYTNEAGTVHLADVAFGHGRTLYTVELAAGEWPDDDALIEWLGGVRECGWGRVEGGGLVRLVIVRGCD